MKTRKIKRWLSVILAIAFILGMMPAVHAQGSGSDDLDDPKDIFDLDKQEPEQLDRYPDDVYGKNQNQPFLLSEQNELALIIGSILIVLGGLYVYMVSDKKRKGERS